MYYIMNKWQDGWEMCTNNKLHEIHLENYMKFEFSKICLFGYKGKPYVPATCKTPFSLKHFYWTVLFSLQSKKK